MAHPSLDARAHIHHLRRSRGTTSPRSHWNVPADQEYPSPKHSLPPDPRSHLSPDRLDRDFRPFHSFFQFLYDPRRFDSPPLFENTCSYTGEQNEQGSCVQQWLSHS